ncbi:MAG: dihydropyrimidinase [Desulfuromusa sp.]|nr:dihydropyrimidinase [Desulfuromusa sp.]
MKKVIKNGVVVTAEESFTADLLVDNDKIAKIAPQIEVDGSTEVIDAAGCYVLPGGVDVHTHLNLALGSRHVSDGFYHGMRAAAFGGTTTIVDHPEAGPAGCSLFHQPRFYQQQIEKEAVIDYGIHGVFQRVDADILRQIPELIESGIPSIKAYLTYDGMLEDGEVEQVLQAMEPAHGLTAFHAEDDETIKRLRVKYGQEGKLSAIYHAKSRPDTAEAEAIRRILEIAERSGNIPVYIVHLSTAKGLEEIKKARQKGQQVFAETCPQYLLLNQSCYQQEGDEGLKYIMAPPLRTAADQETLWQGVIDGSIDVIATDHCSFSFADKVKYGKDDFRQCPGGCPGVETRLPVIFSAAVDKGRITINQFVDLVATNPAKIMGLYPRKGALRVGADADLILWNQNIEKTISVETLHQKCDYTPFAGMVTKGWPILTMVRGQVVVKNGIFIGKKGSGQFIARKL